MTISAASMKLCHINSAESICILFEILLINKTVLKIVAEIGCSYCLCFGVFCVDFCQIFQLQNLLYLEYFFIFCNAGE